MPQHGLIHSCAAELSLEVLRHLTRKYWLRSWAVVNRLSVSPPEDEEIHEELRANERSYRGLVEGFIQGILIHVNGVVRVANRSLARMLGYDWTNQLVGLSIWPHIAPDDRELVAQHMRARMRGEDAPTRYEFRVVRRDAAIIWLDCLVTTIVWDGELAILATMVDVTEKRLLEERHRAAQTLVAVGRLAGAMAHDVNNALTVITANSEFLKHDLGDPVRCREHVDEIRKAADAAATLTRQLLAFSRQQMLEPKDLSLNDIVHDAENILRPLIGEDVELIISLEHGIGRVRVDAGQFAQVLVNLVLNALEAMPNGGFLTIETANVEFTDECVFTEASATPGRYVMLAVSDTGVGMDEQTRARAFEPFFTTKARSERTGLGLSMVYGAVKQSGGVICVYSEPGQGAVFKIYIPIVNRAANISGPADYENAASETVFIVEDDVALRAIARRALERRGYSVIEAGDGKTALFLAAQMSDPIDLLLTDVAMPGTSGRLLAAQLQAARPNLKVLYMSGYADDAVVQRALVERGAAYLQKPFTPEVLSRRVREVLDST